MITHTYRKLDGTTKFSRVDKNLRELTDIIVRPLLIISERSWQPGEVPQDWKKVSATASFKRGSKDDLENYRIAASLRSLGT